MELENKDILKRNVSEKMCSLGSNGAGEICSPETADTCGDCGFDTTERHLEILEFTHFVDFSTFERKGKYHREKKIINQISVTVALDLGVWNTLNPECKVKKELSEES